MLKKAVEHPQEKLVLTEKLTGILLKKSYLKQYFNILTQNLKLNLELNNGTKKEGLSVEEDELFNDMSDTENENLFADSSTLEAHNSLGNFNSNYDIQATDAFNSSRENDSELVVGDEDEFENDSEHADKFLN